MQEMTKQIKTKKQWLDSPNESLTDFLSPGDYVDEAIVEHIYNSVPGPYSQNYVQCGSPYDCVDGKNTYETFVKHEGQWLYKGTCHRCLSEHKKR